MDGLMAVLIKGERVHSLTIPPPWLLLSGTKFKSKPVFKRGSMDLR